MYGHGITTLPQIALCFSDRIFFARLLARKTACSAKTPHRYRTLFSGHFYLPSEWFRMRLTGEIMKIITCFKLVLKNRTLLSLQNIPWISTMPSQNQPVRSQCHWSCKPDCNRDDEIAALTIGGSLLQNSKVRKTCYPAGHIACIWCRMRNLTCTTSRYRKGAGGSSWKDRLDLLIFGEGSGDLYAQQVGLLSEKFYNFRWLMQWVLFSVREYTGDWTHAWRWCWSYWALCPAVLCVTSDINMPRIPSMKAFSARVKNR